MDGLNTTIVFVILLITLTELDKMIYKKLDDDYKKFTLRDKYNESEEYHDSNRIIQVIKNIQSHTGRRSTINKFIGFFILLFIIYFQSNIDKIYHIQIINLLGILILITVAALCAYNLIKGIKIINKFKKKYNKENVNLEMLYIILHSFYFLLAVIVFYI